MTSHSRSVYRHSDLSRTIDPKSIAVVGASQRPGSYGHSALLLLKGWGGRIYAVNERYDEVLGHKCYPSLAALPEAPDCVISTVPQPAVEQVVIDSAARGAGGVVVFAAGYAETGRPEARVAQERLAQIGRAANMRVIGPNVIGILNHSANLIMAFTLGMAAQNPGRVGVGIASQSGGMGSAVAQGSWLGLPVTHMLAAGNSADVSVADYIAYLAEDEHCGVIVSLFEGMSEPRHLLEAAEIAHANNKPLLVCKIATSSAGSEAAKSHTGVMSGAKAVYDAAFRRMNAIMVEDLESLAHTASYFLKTKRPSRGGTAVTASSGGFCTIAADKAEKYGVKLPELSPKTYAALSKIVPEYGRVGNPCDLAAGRTTKEIVGSYDILFQDEQYDIVVLPYIFAAERSVFRATGLDEMARKNNKTGCVVWTTAFVGGPGYAEAATSENLVLFNSMDNCFLTIAQGQAYERKLAEDKAAADSPRVAIDADRRQAAAAALARAGSSASLSERDSKALLKQYGIPVVEEKLVKSADEAVGAASAAGYPVVLKLEVDGLAHKTEVGGVIVGLQSEADVRRAHASMLQVVEKHRFGERFRGVLVQPMVEKGLEVIVGASIDPLFGPTVMVGLGGVLVEVLKDSVVDLAPLTRAQAESMLKRLRGYKLLEGVRGAKGIDQRALADVLCRLSEFAADHAGVLAEIDINPVVCTAERVVAVDALIVTKQAAS